MKRISAFLLAFFLLTISTVGWASCPEGQKEHDRTGECVPIKGAAKRSVPSADEVKQMIQGFIQSQPRNLRTHEEGFSACGQTEEDQYQQDYPCTMQRYRKVRVTFPGRDFILRYTPGANVGFVYPDDIRLMNGAIEIVESADKNKWWVNFKIFDSDADSPWRTGESESRYGRMWIESANPARIKVRIRGALVNDDAVPPLVIGHKNLKSGSPYGGGMGDWFDEWHSIYPDGTFARTLTVYTGVAKFANAYWNRSGFPLETQETMVWMPRGKTPLDVIETEALTVVAMDGRYKKISYIPYPRRDSRDPPWMKGNNIKIINLKGKAVLSFTAIPDDDPDIKAYTKWGRDSTQLAQRVFVGWPRGSTWDRYQVTLVSLSHIINYQWHRRTDTSLTQVYLEGMIDNGSEEEKVGAALAIARSWLNPPAVTVEAKQGTLRYQRYDRESKAFLFKSTGNGNEPVDATIRFDASIDQPLVNPVLVLENYQHPNLKVSIPGADVSSDAIRYGVENKAGQSHTVVWIPYRAITPVAVKLSTNTSQQVQEHATKQTTESTHLCWDKVKKDFYAAINGDCYK